MGHRMIAATRRPMIAPMYSMGMNVPHQCVWDVGEGGGGGDVAARWGSKKEREKKKTEIKISSFVDVT